MLRILRKLYGCEGGATAIEYGLIGGLISVVIIGVLHNVADDMSNMYIYISTSIQNALASS